MTAVIGLSKKVITGYAVEIRKRRNVRIARVVILVRFKPLERGGRYAYGFRQSSQRQFLFIPQVAEFFL